MNPQESQRILKTILQRLIPEIMSILSWSYVWETQNICNVCQEAMQEQHARYTCTICKEDAHCACMMCSLDGSATPICQACGEESPNNEGEPREQEPVMDPELPATILDNTGVLQCQHHGMDHLTRDPGCEFCKRALGPLYRHLKGKYGTGRGSNSNLEF